MAVLQQIRVKFGLAISIIIALALLSFIIDVNTLESAVNSMSSKYDVGQIAGKSISYTDFQEDIEKFTTLNEIMSGSSVHSEQQQAQIRDAAWQSLLDKYMFVKNAKAAGLTVGDAEMVDLTSGERISPMIAQNPFFADAQGNFSKENLVSFIKNLDSDQSGQARIYWNYIQSSIYTQQFYAKYGSLFNASAFENALMTSAAIAENNTTAAVDFVMVPFGFAQDSTVTVSNSEIKSYYKNHKNFFKQNASRDIEYVVFEVVPSVDDIAAANNKVSEVYDEFASTSAMKSFLLKNSDRSLSEYWYREGELSTINKEINDFVFSGAKGTSPVYSSNNTFYAARIMDSAMIPDSVYVKHILLQGADAKNTADSLLKAINRGSDFAANVAVYSADKGSAADGQLGNIGWMTQTYMIPGFESVMTAAVGKPYIVDTQYGTHIVMVTKKTAPKLKKQVAILEKEALASKETFNKYYSQANTFATLANGKIEGYNAAVDSLGIYSHSMNVTEATSSYGAVDQAKEVTRWVFDAKAGKASNIITVNNNFFFVAVVKEIHKEGYTPVKEVASGIRQRLYSEKLGQKKAAEAAEKIAGLSTMEEIAEALGTTVSSKSDIAFASMANQGLDPAFIGAVFGAKLNEISGPVAGNIGVYVFKVNATDTAAFYTEDDAKNFAAQKNQYNSQMVMPVMMEQSNVKDNRARFF